MNTTVKICKYELSDLLRSRWIFAYAIFFLLASEGLLRFSGESVKALLSLHSLVLFVVPLACVLLGTNYIYNSRNFLELLLSQPVNRVFLYRGLYIGLVVPLSLGFLLGAGLPFVWHGVDEPAQILSLGLLGLTGSLLTAIFIALAIAVAFFWEDRTKGMAWALSLWLFFVFVFDAVVLLVINTFAQYPLEVPLIVLSLLNPVDLSRFVFLMQSDVAAMLGYTGAVFDSFFGSGLGIGVSLGTLLVWMLVPFLTGQYVFKYRDF